jgi:antitoxin (DNA-binding transcriptional repressor) of toxin-antitoxin stability system
MLRELCNANLDEAVERAGRGERTIVRQKGKPSFAVVPAADAEYMQRIEDELNLRLLRDAHANKGEKISWRQLRAELDAKYAIRN